MKKAIYMFNFDCGRMGSLRGVFISTKEKVAKLIECGVEVYFGEVLGKHSEIYGAIKNEHVAFETDDENTMKRIERIGLVSGTNPFDYECINFEVDGEDMEGMNIGELIDLLLEKESNSAPNLKN